MLSGQGRPGSLHALGWGLRGRSGRQGAVGWVHRCPGLWGRASRLGWGPWNCLRAPRLSPSCTKPMRPAAPQGTGLRLTMPTRPTPVVARTWGRVFPLWALAGTGRLAGPGGRCAVNETPKVLGEVVGPSCCRRSLLRGKALLGPGPLPPLYTGVCARACEHSRAGRGQARALGTSGLAELRVGVQKLISDPNTPLWTSPQRAPG